MERDSYRGAGGNFRALFGVDNLYHRLRLGPEAFRWVCENYVVAVAAVLGVSSCLRIFCFNCPNSTVLCAEMGRQEESIRWVRTWQSSLCHGDP